MDKKGVLQYALEQFGSEPEYLWAKNPTYCILRHTNNRKWYAAVMEVPRNKLGLSGAGTAEILNVKCDPVLLGSLLESDGFLPAYHMSKSNWVSILLDGQVPDEEVISLLTISYDRTKGRI